MTTVSNTITVENTVFETIESLADITMTSGKTYSMQVQNIAEIKIADAVFTVCNEKFSLTQGDDDVYIRTLGIPAKLTILENA